MGKADFIYCADNYIHSVKIAKWETVWPYLSNVLWIYNGYYMYFSRVASYSAN